MGLVKTYQLHQVRRLLHGYPWIDVGTYLDSCETTMVQVLDSCCFELFIISLSLTRYG